MTARSTRYGRVLSPSKYSTVSTICSMTLGPAMAPSLLTWPTMKVGISSVLATFKKRAELSLTWLTVPAEEEISVQRIVWIESMTTRSGFIDSIRPQISSTSLSATSEMLSSGTFRRTARSLICRTDSSPVT